MKYKFSGHETFQCRHFWLKKGYDFLLKKGDFNDSEALIELGVGKNMISAIKHWLKAFQVIDSESSEILPLGHYLFGEDGKDPYLEDIGSLNLLHFKLVENLSQSSIYQIVFEDFRKKRISLDFSSDQLFDFVTKKLILEGEAFSEKSLKNDIKVFLKTYQTSTKKNIKSIEDDYSSILIDLSLIDELEGVSESNSQVYQMRYDERSDLNYLIFFYAILTTFTSQSSISVEDIQREVSDKFLCNREGTEEKLLELENEGYIVYKQDAGRKEVQMKDSLDELQILNQYYGRV